MASTRLSKRFPIRPSAQHSPSPDMGSKSFIASTTPPKINQQHLTSKRDKDQSINRIKEENKKLKDEMRNILNNNKQTESIYVDDSLSHRRIKNQIIMKEQDPKIVNDRQIKKQSYTKPNSSSPQASSLNLGVMKEQFSSLIKQKEERLGDLIKELQLKLEESEEKQRILQKKVDEYKSQELQTSIKRKIDFDSSPISQRGSPNILNTTPIKFSPSQSYKQLMIDLQSQLSGAQSTIRRLQTILETDQKSYSSLKFESERKERAISQLKREIIDIKQTAKQWSEKFQASQQKQLSEKKQLKLMYEKQIDKLSQLISTLQNKLILKQKQLREHERYNDQLKMQYHEQRGQQVNRLNEQIKSHKQEIKRLSEQANSSIRVSRLLFQDQKKENIQDNNAYIQNLHAKIVQLTSKLSHSYNQINESKLKTIQQAHSNYQDRISALQSQNLTLVQNFQKVRLELEEIEVINSRLNQQKSQVESLTSQLTEAIKTLETTKDQYKSQNLSFLNQVKAIRSITQSIDLQDSEVPRNSNNQNLHQQIDSMNLNHRQQILKFQSLIGSLQSQNQKSKLITQSLKKQNQTLKQQIQSLNISIRNYSKPIPHKVISHEQIQSILLKQQKQPNMRVQNANKIINGVSNRLGKLYEQINKSGKQ